MPWWVILSGGDHGHAEAMQRADADLVELQLLSEPTMAGLSARQPAP
jgi:hypothetical protein